MNNTGCTVEIFPTAGALADAAARRFLESAERAIALRNRFSVALSGGSTPKALYRRLAEGPLPGGIDWQRVHFFWGDERNVPADHPDSNYRMAAEALLSRVPVPARNIHPIMGEGHPPEAADAYEAVLDGFFAGSAERFDLVLLGVGADGHTASIFPGARTDGTAGDNEPSRRVAATFVDTLGAWRITLTPETINRAAQIVFLAAGAEKATIVNDVLNGPYRPERLPAQGIRPLNGRLIWMLDEAAARLLDVEDGDDGAAD